ncbi:MAG: hypothetical protein LBS55_03955 [Prevotellaceae bacterium]|jgi:hypothetical protein|nr:hypothetical protein [Prevotellaceae bacterium]
MEAKEKRIHIIYGNICGALFALVTIALAFAIPEDIACDSLSFSLKSLSTIIGIFVSVIGIIITSYFVILAINAYSHIKDVKKDVEDFQSHKNELYILSKNYALSLFNGLEIQIWLAEEYKLAVERNKLTLAQARLSFQQIMLDKEHRLPLLLKLEAIGEVQDINNIKMIICNPNEDKEIKDYAKLVLEELKKRLGII